MKKKILLLIVLPLLMTVVAYADDFEFPQKDIDIDSLSDKNPFEPQLPVKPKKEKQKPKIKKTTSTTSAKQRRKGGNVVLQTTADSLKKNLDMRQKIPTKPKLSISGLVWNSDRPQAIVNGKVVDIGDRLAGDKIKIVSIQKGSIDILFEGEIMNITP